MTTAAMASLAADRAQLRSGLAERGFADDGGLHPHDEREHLLQRGPKDRLFLSECVEHVRARFVATT